MVRIRSFALVTIAGWLAAGQPVAAAPAPDRQIDEKIRELRKAQIEELRQQLEDQLERLKLGKDRVVTLVTAIFDLGEAEVEVAETKEAAQTALDAMVKRLKDAEDSVEEWRVAGLATRAQVAELRAARLKAEIQREKWKKR